jgi:hypothetical protein
MEQDRPYVLLEAFDPGTIELWAANGARKCWQRECERLGL